jgi:hypothetical protein
MDELERQRVLRLFRLAHRDGWNVHEDSTGIFITKPGEYRIFVDRCVDPEEGVEFVQVVVDDLAERRKLLELVPRSLTEILHVLSALGIFNRWDLFDDHP